MSGPQYEFDGPSPYPDGAQGMFAEETQPRTLYVGNLDVQMTEEFLLALFSHIGQVKGCKIIHEVRLLMLIIAFGAVSAGFWNTRPKFTRARLRPPRHHPERMQSSHHHRAHHLQAKAYHPPMNQRLPPPHHHVPIKTYRSPNAIPFVRSASPHVFQYPIKQHQLMKHTFMPQNVKVDHDQVKDVEIVNFDNNNAEAQDDGSIHGYLASTYKGWRPIAKPNYLYRFDNDLKQSSSTSNYFVYPTTEVYSDSQNKQQDMYVSTVGPLNQLISMKLAPQYSENQDVVILPPVSFNNFQGNMSSQEQQKASQFSFQDALLQVGQSGGDAVIRKPFPRFPSKLRKFNTTSGSLIPEDQPPPPKQQQLSKFKISKPRLRGISPQAPNSENGPQLDAPVQPSSFDTSTSVPEFSGASRPPLNLKGKISTKVRKRVKVPRQNEQDRPQGFVNTEDLGSLFKKDRDQYENAGPFQGSPVEQPALPVIHENTTPGNGYFQNVPQSNSNYDDNIGTNPHNLPPPPEKEAVRFHPVKEFYHVPQTNINTNRDIQPLEPSLGKNNNSPGLEEREKRRPTESVVFNEGENPLYANDFFMPTGFFKNSQFDGLDPVSFMSVDMGLSDANPKPSVVHHSIPPHNQDHQQNYAPIRSLHPPVKGNYRNPQDFRENHAQQNFVFTINTQPGNPNPILNGNHAGQSLSTFRPLPSSPQIYETTIPPSSLTSYSTTAPYQSFIYNSQPNQHLPTRQPPLPPVPSVLPTVPRHIQRQRSPTTPMSHVQFGNQQTFPGPVFDFKIAKAPQIGSNNLPHAEANNLIPVNHGFGKGKLDSYYHEPDAFSTNEYERIPMEFINELRPILLNDELIQTTSSPSSTIRTNNDYNSNGLYQPSAFFDNFFKPFNTAQGISTKLVPPAAPSFKNHRLNSVDVQEASSNSQIYIRQPPPKFTSSTTPSTSTFTPSQQIFDSPDHYMEFVKIESQVPKAWSKVKPVSDDATSLISTDAKNEKGQHKDAERDQKEVKKTSKQSNRVLPSTSTNPSKIETTTPSYGNPSPLLNIIPSSTNSISDELKEESNTPSSLAITKDRTNIRKVIRTRTSSVSEKSSKVIRRPIKVPVDRNRILTPRTRQRLSDNKENSSEVSVTTHRPRRIFTSSTSTEKSTTTKPVEFDSFRVRPKRRRVVLRKAISPLRTESSEMKESDNTSSVSPDDVTYGESQWFQVSSTEGYYSNPGRIHHANNKDDKLARLSTHTLAPVKANVQANSGESVSLETSSESIIESEPSSPRRLLTSSEYEVEHENVNNEFFESTKTD